VNTVECCVLIGSVNSTVDWSGIPSSICRVPSCKWHRRPKPDEGCRLSRGVEPATDLWRGTGAFLQQRKTERGKLKDYFSTMYVLIVVLGVKQACDGAGGSSDTKLLKSMFLQYNVDWSV